jgi:hypothetical protein
MGRRIYRKVAPLARRRELSHVRPSPNHRPGAQMSKSDDRKLEKLARKNAAKVAKIKPNRRRQYDSTLPPEQDEDIERRDFFSEMKKREF